MKRVAILPARGGSKRLPRKNILPVMNRPMISYPITAAIESGLFNAVIVSTEDEEIAHIARSAGAQVMKRPQVLAADTATVAKVCLHVLNDLHSENQSPDYFCCIYATAFLTTPKDLIESFTLLLSEPQTDFVMGVSEYNLPPVQALREEDGVLTPMWPELITTQSQFQPKLVASNGTLYWAGVPAFLKAKSFYGEGLKGYLIPKIRSIDIDTPEDLKIAKILSRNLLEKNKS